MQPEQYATHWQAATLWLHSMADACAKPVSCLPVLCSAWVRSGSTQAARDNAVLVLGCERNGAAELHEAVQGAQALISGVSLHCHWR